MQGITTDFELLHYSDRHLDALLVGVLIRSAFDCGSRGGDQFYDGDAACQGSTSRCCGISPKAVKHVRIVRGSPQTSRAAASPATCRLPRGYLGCATRCARPSPYRCTTSSPSVSCQIIRDTSLSLNTSLPKDRIFAKLLASPPSHARSILPPTRRPVVVVAKARASLLCIRSPTEWRTNASLAPLLLASPSRLLRFSRYPPS
jgi:hypothetical protein